MSNALGLAAVTAVLKDLLNNGVIDHDLASAVGAVTVSALPPDRIQTGTDEDNRLNLFLYHVSPNVGWRNVDLPSRNGNGRRTSTPPLALDLHYLLTAYGGSELHAEILLGYGMQLLHEHPVLGRDEIRRALAAPSPVDSGALPPAFQSLSAATLAEQAEQIKIVPQSLGTEEMSKLWTALQASYRPTAAYQATVVLIESKLPARSPLPVLIRGRWSSELGREEGVRVQPSLLPPFPTLREAVPPAEQPAVRMGETLLLRGHHLEGDEVVARFTHPRSGRTFELPATANPAGTELQVDLPADPDDWRAGIHGIAAAVRTAGQPERGDQRARRRGRAPHRRRRLERFRGHGDLHGVSRATRLAHAAHRPDRRRAGDERGADPAGPRTPGRAREHPYSDLSDFGIGACEWRPVGPPAGGRHREHPRPARHRSAPLRSVAAGDDPMSSVVMEADWHAANQRHLMAAVGQVRQSLERHSGAAGAARDEGDEGDQPSGAGLPSPSVLERVCELFGLSPFERDVLLLCAGIELDGSFAELCAAAQGDPGRPYPTFGLALAALKESHWSALTPAAPLRFWRLVELGGEGLTASPLRIDERVLHALAGVPYLDDRLRGLIEPVSDGAELPPSHQALAERIAGFWSGEKSEQQHRTAELFGSDAAAALSISAAAATLLGLPLHRLRAAHLPDAATERAALARLWEREAVLGGGALLVELADRDPPEVVRRTVEFIEHVHTPLVVGSGEPLPPTARSSRIRLAVPPISSAEQRQLWRAAVGENSAVLNGALDAVVSQFRLGPDRIHAAAALLGTSPNGDAGAALWDACRTQARTGLEDLAQRIEPAAGWDDLVLPPAQLGLLREIAIQVRGRATVYERWGWEEKGSRGLGISALFAGPSGTGKTMAAEVLASELRLDLYRIDLSSVVSKYIGETEKNLRRVFDAAEAGGAILLFDEADALFGKRSEVKDSHDRYANLEVGYLLQRMEAYRGLAILTTNLRSALDPAFLRRLRFVVDFPFPDAAARAEIWRRIFPTATPTEQLEPDKLARLSVAGGNIRNIALHAAFLAADAGEPVRMPHLLRAARGEYAKLEKPLSSGEVGGWT